MNAGINNVQQYTVRSTARRQLRNEESNQDNQTQESKSKLKKILIIILIILVLLTAVVLLVVFMLRKKKEESIQENYPYEITASYKLEKNKEATLFNPSRVGLTDEQYKIEYISDDRKIRRRLEEIKITDGKLIPTETELIKIAIKIKEELTNLNFLFQGSENLIDADFSKFNMEGITNMMYLFAECSNLEKVNFASLNTSKVEFMEFMFGLCTNLKKVDGIENFNTTTVKNSAGMFYSCENLVSLNLSSFNFENNEAQQGMFAKTDSLQLLDIRNLNNSDDMFGSPLTTTNYLTIVSNDAANNTDLNQYKNFKVVTDYAGINKIDFKLDCEEGCQKCSDDGSSCLQCKNGYFNYSLYPPKEEKNEIILFAEPLKKNSSILLALQNRRRLIQNCYKCDKGCESCEGVWIKAGSFASYGINCTSCEYGYIFDEYVYDNFNKSLGYCVLDCTGTSCKECNYDENNDRICSSCSDGYIMRNNTCIKSCDTLRNEGCETCIDDGINVPKCTVCKSGFFLPKDSSICNKCALIGCKKCFGENETNNVCEECEADIFPVIMNNKIVSCENTCEIGDDEKCSSCAKKKGDCASCNNGYVLLNGKCTECAFIATYRTTKENEKIQLFLKISIGKMKVDGVEVTKPSNIYTFPQSGDHEVCVRFDKTPSIANLFAGNRNVVSIIFNPNFDTSKLTFVNGAFKNCPLLKYIDFSRINLRNAHCIHYWFQYDSSLETVIFSSTYKITPYYLDHTFQGCTSLTSIDLSSFELSGVYNLQEMFYGCTKLKYIDISNFNHPEKSYNVKNMFYGLPSGGKIKINTKTIPRSILNKIPSSWTKI